MYQVKLSYICCTSSLVWTSFPTPTAVNVLKTAPLQCMEPFYLSKLRRIFDDLFLGLRNIKPEYINNEESKREWERLNTYFQWTPGTQWAEDLIINENMSDLLHKYMMIVCAHMLTVDVTSSCPGWPWLLTFIDTQLAKKKVMQSSLPSASTMDMDTKLAQLKLHAAFFQSLQ